MEQETILLDTEVGDNKLRDAYSQLLNIPTTQIFIVRDEMEYFGQNDQNYENVLIVKRYDFKYGDFIVELFPLICSWTRNNSFDEDYELYKSLSKELECSILIPGNFKDLTEEYYIILKDGQHISQVFVEHPEEYGDYGVYVQREKL